MPVSKADNQIAVEGEHIQRREKTYLMMNKPRGLLTTASDEKGRETVYTLLNQKASLPWVAPIGRLDKASEGLLLLTNDSEWGARVAARKRISQRPIMCRSVPSPMRISFKR